jgi:type I restriction enzyme, S subunit
MISKIQTKFKDTEIGTIPEEWDVLDIDMAVDIIDGDRGINYPNGSDFSGDGYCLFLNTKNVPGDSFDFSNCQFITQEKDDKLRKGKLKRGDFVLTTRGTVGNIAFYDQKVNFDNIRINSGMVVLRNGDKFDSKYLLHLLKSWIIRKQIAELTTGSAQPQLPIRDLKYLKLAKPTLNEQKQIAEILSSLDDKIELNRQMNANLDRLASSLFKHWFVDFEFPDKNGKPYKSSGGKMVDSELGEIPDGWGVGKLEEEFEIIMGQSPSGDTYNEIGEGLPLYQGRTDFGFRFPSRRVYCSEPKRKARALDTLVSVRAPVGDINMAYEECCIGRGVGAIRKENFPSYTFYTVKSLQSLISRYDDEGTVFGSINKDSLSNIACPAPPKAFIVEFEKKSGDIDKQILNLTEENGSLINLRDFLLPRLMNGKIRVNI